MFPLALQGWARSLAESAVRPLAARGISPNVITVIGFLLNVITAGVLATGRLTLGGVLVFVSGIFDMFDGALARVTRSQTTFGAFLDSFLDRYSEAFLLLALLYVFTSHHNTVTVLLIYVVAVGSLMISYARARAEGLGLEGKAGLAARPERILILGLGLLFGSGTTTAALTVLAVLTHFTALQRLYYVWRQARDTPPPL